MDNLYAIRPARKEEAEVLTHISFASKAYWNYPQEFFEIWKKELTITPNYIEQNEVVILTCNGVTVGYYSLVALPEDIEISGIAIKKGHWLEHMFVRPEYIGKGFGSAMFQHLREKCILMGIDELGILSDPNARGFYEKMGCTFLREYPSTIQKRTTPYLQLQLKAS